MSDHNSSPDQSPVNPIPPVVVALFFVLIGIEGALWLGSKGLIGGPQAIGWRQALIEDYGFNDRIFEWMRANALFPPELMVRFLSYQFIHANLTHAIFAGVMVLAIGKMVAETFASWAFVLIFMLSGVTGAVVYGIVLDTPYWLVGAFPGIYGLIGAFTFLLWVRLGVVGANQVRAFTMIGFLLGIQLLFGLLFGGNKDWVADVVGFATGFGLSFIFVPGGWAKIRAMIRRN